jgi:predicted nucleic acid-binding protein
LRETLVIDASVAVKWVIDEEGSAAAVGLRSRFSFAAPDLLVAECANILWKKAQRSELTPAEAGMAARLLERAGIELMPMGKLLGEATGLAIELGHPAYDCIYLALARQNQWCFVTADAHLLRAVRDKAHEDLAGLCVALDQIGVGEP